MRDYVTLVGGEEVQRAANTLSAAAERMNTAAGTINDPWMIQRLDEIVGRFVDAVDRFEKATEKLKEARP